ncbi:DUF368 domain-containing protein [Alkaliphilus serpentinus]|uniref:DUF368 domain-containing protein n=1 Tax=Alkaliphilus serpentinus TaxID=1482731 RepID=A0A833HR16_9FIRM|nr:DUF368 domain-containing protein [Alkaliphilus serpentinus]KAB3532729.1 DUF368 domain-containing protein [Alkaliphilus serpentinus]
MEQIIKGFILGFIIVMPGMSGGTVFVIFGIYENLIKDLVKLNIKPYIPLLIGSIAGIFMGAFAFAAVFETYRDATVAFLLGCLLASIRSVLKSCPGVNAKRLTALAVGFIAGYYMVGDPISIVNAGEDVNWLVLFIGGAFASAAMIIPGIPGSSVLIVLGIYDSILYYIKEVAMVPLTIFAAGSAVGILALVNTLAKLYDKHRGIISYFFAGLILGSSRALLPNNYGLTVLITFVLGFSMVWYFSGKEQ